MTEHQYPCRAHLEERSCHECRQIADERSYWGEEEWTSYRKEQAEKRKVKSNDCENG